jgi:hypothetical protein
MIQKTSGDLKALDKGSAAANKVSLFLVAFKLF